MLLTPAPIPEVAKPWWRSTTIQGLVILILSMVLKRALPHVTVSDAEVSAFVDLLYQIIDLVVQAVGAVMVVRGRVAASKVITGTTREAKAINDENKIVMGDAVN